MDKQDSTTKGGLGARLVAARRAAFVGRTAELELFRAALDQQPPPFAVLHVHGPGGIGKSTLLDQFAHLADEDGRRVLRLDGRELEVSPEGLLGGLADATGSVPDDVVADIASGPPPVLLLDTYELLGSVDGWLRETLLPQLPQHALVVLASRRRPAAGWRSDPAWNDLLRVVALRDLRADNARQLLAARGLDAPAQQRVLEVVRGHPLGLVLVADVLGAAGATEGELASLRDTPEVIDTLLRRFLRQVPDQDRRRALYAAALAGVATQALLRDVVGGGARAAFDWLRQLSFVAPTVDGVAVHDLAADAISADLRWRDRDAWAELHAVITRHAERRVARSEGVDKHRRLMDLLRLYRHHPLARRFYELDDDDDRWVEPATPEHHDEIVALTRVHEGDAGAAIATYWLDRQPEAFGVIRGHGTEQLDGFLTHLSLRGGRGEDADADPVVARIWEHVRGTAPLRAGETLRVMRHWIMREGHQPIAGHHLVSARAAMDWIDPDLAWAVVVLADPDLYEPIFEFIDFVRLEEEVAVGEHSFGLFARDMRRTSLRDWLDMLRDRRAGVEVGAGEPRAAVSRLLVLAQDDFAEAVRDALRGLARPAGLEGNPLLRSRVVVERAGEEPPEAVLAELLRALVADLGEHPRDAKLHRALVATYVSPAPTQEAAAERLDLPFSTFRRHLSQGVEHVVERLWDQELHGAG